MMTSNQNTSYAAKTLAYVRCAAIFMMGLIGFSGSAFSQCVVTKTFSYDPPAGASPILANPLAPNIKALLKIVVAGDSVMWGDGLKPEEKFVALFGKDMAALTGRHVEVTSFAHSGARLYKVDDESSTIPVVDGGPQGDLDSQKPTTKEQLTCAGESARWSDAEIVLLDGCINDVGAIQIALPFPFNFTTDENIANDAAECGPKMNEVLVKAAEQFKQAAIVVINYYRIVSADSRPVIGRGDQRQSAIVKGSSPATVDRLTKEQQKLLDMSGRRKEFTEAAKGHAPSTTKEAGFQRWDDNAEAFLSSTETCFDWAIAQVNKLAGEANCTPLFPPPNHPAATPYLGLVTSDRRVFLARVPDNPANSYGAPDTHLWRLTVSFLFWTCGADHMYRIRKQLCTKYFPPGFDRYKCEHNPIAHPNVKGAKAYRDSLVQVLTTAWAKAPSADAHNR